MIIISFYVFSLYFSACSLTCELGYGPNDNCTSCEAKHDCLTNNPCQNGATCVINSPTINNYTCTCAQHFTGQHCDGETEKINLFYSTSLFV